MGRVNKKKLAEYAEENDELNKSKEKEGDVQKSAIDLEDSDSENGNESNKARSVTKKGNADPDDEDDYEGNEDDEEDEDFKSLQGDEELEHDADDAAGKKTHKRKIIEKAGKKDSAADKNDAGSSDEDEPLGSGPSPSKKSRKATGGGKTKAAATKNGKAAKGGSKDKKASKKSQDVDEDEEEEEEEEYEVKEIVDHKVERGVSYFLIRWKGYTKADDTWEPEDTLSCPDIIEKYKKKQSANGGKSAKKATSPAKKGRTEKGAKEDPNKEWEVDKIIDYAEEKSGRVFRIRWKGFGPKHDTWEPEENLYCDEIIDKFMKRMKTQENVSFKELRQEPKKPKRLVNETVPRTHFKNPTGRSSKRSVSKKRVYYGDSDE